MPAAGCPARARSSSRATPDDPQLLRDQIYTYDTDSGELEQLTSNPQGVLGGMMWQAPEFRNEYVFFTMAKFRQQILVYRKLPGADRVLRWTIVKTIDAPPALPFFFSPEVFTHNGRSYIFAEVSSSSKFFDRTVPNQLAMSGVDPLRVDFRMLTNDAGTPRLGSTRNSSSPPRARTSTTTGWSPRPMPTPPSTTASGASSALGTGLGPPRLSRTDHGIHDQTWTLTKRTSASENAFQTGMVVPPIFA